MLSPDSRAMNDRSVQDILARYQDRVRGFDEIAARRGNVQIAEFAPPALDQQPTRREVGVLELVAQGLSNKEIGGRLFLSEDTIKTHVRNLLIKLRARNRAHAAALGLQRGLIELPPLQQAA